MHRTGDVGRQRLRRVPAPMRVVEEGARQRHHIGLAFGDDGFGLFGVRDHADRAHHDADLAAKPLGNRRVVTRAGRRSDLSRRTARRDVDVIEPHLRQASGPIGWRRDRPDYRGERPFAIEFDTCCPMGRCEAAQTVR